MAIRFRKRIKLAPGVKLNLSGKSVGVTVGGKHARVSANSSGRVTVGTSVPGTGLYSTQRVKSANPSQPVQQQARSSARTHPNRGFPVWGWILIILAAIPFIAGLIPDRQTSETPARAPVEQTAQAQQAEADRAVVESALTAIGEAFAEAAGGAPVSVHGSDSGVAVTIKRADLSIDGPPENWPELIEAVAAETDRSVRTTATVEAADGTILLTCSGGRVRYDAFTPPEEPKNLDIQMGVSSGPLSTVYVSASGKMHKDSGCSGLKDYTIMSQEEAERQGCSRCSRCW